ncbi:uncharacterized protein [Fopius arisanus]|uniref:Uncharacterized protein n=1 Tax=Fopius arisanus TaxID=64838 RepID=A0A9R1THI9_9HYME|nr:PREDICTED: uncharacterized protein LOC105270484 [Fopius arisanus]
MKCFLQIFFIAALLKLQINAEVVNNQSQPLTFHHAALMKNVLRISKNKVSDLDRVFRDRVMNSIFIERVDPTLQEFKSSMISMNHSLCYSSMSYNFYSPDFQNAVTQCITLSIPKSQPIVHEIDSLLNKLDQLDANIDAAKIDCSRKNETDPCLDAIIQSYQENLQKCVEDQTAINSHIQQIFLDAEMQAVKCAHIEEHIEAAKNKTLNCLSRAPKMPMQMNPMN